MDNAAFRKFVTALKASPAATQALFCGDLEQEVLRSHLDPAARKVAEGVSLESKLGALLARQKTVAGGCVDSCEATRGFAVGEGRNPAGCTTTCIDTCAANSCAITMEHGWNERIALEQGGCGPQTTCSCTSGTCGGATCGGSTCSATCTGDSCGNTCGNSCDMTTNLESPFEMIGRIRNQMARWR